MKKQLALLLTFAIVATGSVRADVDKATRELRNEVRIDGHGSVMRLLWEGADPCWVDAGKAALHNAAEQGELDALFAMLEVVTMKGLSVDVPDGHGMSALCLAAQNGKVDAVSQLLDCNANPNYIANNSNMTPLCFAAEGGHEAVIQTLINARANTNERMPNTGYTPLHYAAFNGKTLAVMCLRRHGAIEYEDNSGRTPSMYVRRASIEFPGNRDAVFQAREALLKALAADS